MFVRLIPIYVTWIIIFPWVNARLPESTKDCCPDKFWCPPHAKELSVNHVAGKDRSKDPAAKVRKGTCRESRQLEICWNPYQIHCFMLKWAVRVEYVSTSDPSDLDCSLDSPGHLGSKAKSHQISTSTSGPKAISCRTLKLNICCSMSHLNLGPLGGQQPS